MDDRPLYRHVQHGAALRILMFGLSGVFLLIALVVLFGTGDPHGVAVIFMMASSIRLICGMTFSTMTIEVTPSDVRWWFGSGWPGGRIARRELTAEELTNPGFFGGVGLHLTMRGWLWNVSFGTAVALHRNGRLATMLGTDDPAGLIAALRG
jgi:hypothetical protein